MICYCSYLGTKSLFLITTSESSIAPREMGFKNHPFMGVSGYCSLTIFL